MDDYINPRDALKAEEEEHRKKQQEQTARSFPEQPEKDVLLFLIEHAPLKPWQRDVLSIIRDEAYYFAPQGQTKIMNEGWASYWHSHDHDPARRSTPSEVHRLRRPSLRHDGHVSAAGSIRTSSASSCSATSRTAGTPGSSARNTTNATTWKSGATGTRSWAWAGKKIFEVRRIHNDITFIDTFLTPEFCVEHKLFSFAYQEQSGQLRDRVARISRRSSSGCCSA